MMSTIDCLFVMLKFTKTRPTPQKGPNKKKNKNKNKSGLKRKKSDTINDPSIPKKNKGGKPGIMSRMVMPRDAGPWGAGGGNPWDDGVFSAIKQIRVYERECNVIYALQFEYLKKDGLSNWSKIHGRTNGVRNIKLVKLDGKDEYSTGISGVYGPVEGYDGVDAIASITFHTNKRIHGPYEEARGAGLAYFSSTTSSGKVVGFHGRKNNGLLSAIGVHMEY